MAFEDLTVCGKGQVRKVVKRFGATHLLSIVDPGDRMPTPHRIARENHFTAIFDDVESPDIQNAPTRADIERVIEWVDRLSADARLAIHCTAGVSRSTAIAFALLCREMELEQARDRLLEIRPQASPNALITSLMDELFEMNGKLHATALEVRSKDLKRILPNLNIRSSNSANESGRENPRMAAARADDEETKN